MSNIDIEVAAPLNPTKKVGRFTFSKEEVKEGSTPPIWKTFNFWIETTIFVISVLGAICIAFGVMEGFLLWFQLYLHWLFFLQKTVSASLTTTCFFDNHNFGYSPPFRKYF
jgi:hypothetical protein